MPFKTALKELVGKVSGARGAILADWEGEAVEQTGEMDDYELKVLGAHKGVILDKLRGVAKSLEGDDLHEIVITTEKQHTLVMPVTHEYFVVLAIDRKSILGRALYEARRCVLRLHDEVA